MLDPTTANTINAWMNFHIRQIYQIGKHHASI